MRHNNAGRKLGRNSSHRAALYRNLVTSLFEHGKVQTTDAKAKELRKVAERLITLGKKGDLHARRRALAFVRDKDVVAKLFSEVSARFATRPGGYTRIVKLWARRGDNAPLSMLELVQEPYAPRPKKVKPQPAAQAVAAAAPQEAPVAEAAPAAIEAPEA